MSFVSGSVVYNIYILNKQNNSLSIHKALFDSGSVGSVGSAFSVRHVATMGAASSPFHKDFCLLAVANPAVVET